MRLASYSLSVALLALGSPAVRAHDAPSLTLNQQNGVVYVMLTNLGHQSIKVRRDYLLDRLLGSLSFDIKRDGKAYPETAHISPELPTETTYMVLEPGQISGHTFDQWLIRSAYSLTEGCYLLSAVYRDGMASDFSAFNGELKSNSIEICFKDAHKAH